MGVELFVPVFDKCVMTTLSTRKKAAIVQAAVELFQLNGFQGTSMDAIAKEANVSKRTVYNHFASKQVLFEHIAQNVWQSVNQAISATYDPNRALLPQLKALVMEELAVLGDETFLRLSRVLMAEFIHDSTMAKGIIERFNEQQSSLLLWMKGALQHGQIHGSDAEQAATQFHSLIKAQAFWPQLMFGQEAMPEAYYDEFSIKVCQMFLAVYGGASIE